MTHPLVKKYDKKEEYLAAKTDLLNAGHSKNSQLVQSLNSSNRDHHVHYFFKKREEPKEKTHPLVKPYPSLEGYQAARQTLIDMSFKPQSFMIKELNKVNSNHYTADRDKRQAERTKNSNTRRRKNRNNNNNNNNLAPAIAKNKRARSTSHSQPRETPPRPNVSLAIFNPQGKNGNDFVNSITRGF